MEDEAVTGFTKVIENIKDRRSRPSKAGAVKARIDEEKYIAQNWPWQKIYDAMSESQQEMWKHDAKLTILEAKFKEDRSHLNRKAQIHNEKLAKFKRIIIWKKKFMQLKK